MIHDSYTCTLSQNSDIRSWPTQRSTENSPNYVGSTGNSISLETDGPCPEKCRPQYHEDWLLC